MQKLYTAKKRLATGGANAETAVGDLLKIP